MSRESEVYLLTLKESISDARDKVNGARELAQEMNLWEIEGALREVFQQLCVLVSETDNYDENLLLKRQNTMFRIEQALKQGREMPQEVYVPATKKAVTAEMLDEYE